MEPLPTPPAELKALAPFIQRGNELLKADPIMSYWCIFFAAQQGIGSKPQGKDSKEMLMKILDSLEARKAALGQDSAITDDLAGSAYVENFALKVFVGADNEDRGSKATRATAKKFIAASNFLELLKLFGELKPEMTEKIKYAKWKAADIAKAFREGRQPTPGPPGGLEAEEEAGAAAALEGAPVNLSLAPSREEDEYVAREMAKLMGDVSLADNKPLEADAVEEAEVATAISPAVPDLGTDPFLGLLGAADGEGDGADEQTKRDRRMSLARRKAQLSVSSSPSAASTNFSMPLRHPVSRESSTEQVPGINTHPQPAATTLPTSPGLPPPPSLQVPAPMTPGTSAGEMGVSGSVNMSANSSTGSRPLPTPPPRDGLPVPPQRNSMIFTGASNAPAGGPPSFASGFLPGQRPPHQPGLPPTPSGLPPPSFHGEYSLPPFISSGHNTPSPGASPGLPKSALPQQGGAPSAPPGLPPSTSTAAPSAPPFPTATATTNGIGTEPPTLPAAPSAPVAPRPTAAAAAPPPPLPVPIASALPESLPPLLSTRVQKLTKFAASALDYDDLDTARRQLREALDICEGRITK